MAKYTPKNKKAIRFGNSLTRKLLVLLLLSAVLLGASVWGVSAKYVHHSEGRGIVKAKEFYFTSDYLTPGGASYTLNPGTTEITFTLRNYDGIKISELPIDYTVKKGEEEVASGKLSAETEQSQSITLSGLTPGVYQVTATGQNGYSRILSATFTVRESTDGIYKHTENYGDYVILTIWTQGVEKDATVTIPAGLIPDYTDAALNGKNANEVFDVNLKENQSVSYRFFTTGTYNKAPIMVTSGGELPETPLS